MFNELIFVDGVIDKELPYVGGSPYLPESIDWPADSSGEPLLHLASLPALFIKKYSKILSLDDGLVVSIFTPYSLTSDSYIYKAMNEGGKVIVYKPGDEPRDGHGHPIACPRLIKVFENPEEDSDENTTAKIAGIPAWIQDEESRSDLIYILQINNSRLNKAAPTHKSIFVGGNGYLFLKESISSENLFAGEFLIQTS